MCVYVYVCLNKRLIFHYFCHRSAMGYMHMRIRKDPTERNFQLSDFNRRFITIPEMVHHYTRNRLPIKGAEHMCLKTPVPMQLL